MQVNSKVNLLLFIFLFPISDIKMSSCPLSVKSVICPTALIYFSTSAILEKTTSRIATLIPAGESFILQETFQHRSVCLCKIVFAISSYLQRRVSRTLYQMITILNQILR